MSVFLVAKVQSIIIKMEMRFQAHASPIVWRPVKIDALRLDDL